MLIMILCQSEPVLPLQMPNSLSTQQQSSAVPAVLNLPAPALNYLSLCPLTLVICQIAICQGTWTTNSSSSTSGACALICRLVYDMLGKKIITTYKNVSNCAISIRKISCFAHQHNSRTICVVCLTSLCWSNKLSELPNECESDSEEVKW